MQKLLDFFSFFWFCVLMAAVFAVTGFHWGLLIGSIFTLLLAGFLYLAGTALVRKLAEKGQFFAICPTNKMLAIEKYGNLHKLIFAPTDARRNEISRWAKKIEKLEGKHKPLVLEKGSSGLVWVGYPQIYRVRSYYLTKLDERADKEGNKKDKEHHSLYLGEIVLHWDSAHKGDDGKQGISSGYEEDGIPDFESGDPVQVASAATLYLRAADFTKPLYAVNHLKDAIRDAFLDVYRRTLSELRFFLVTKEAGKSDDEASGSTTQAEKKAEEMLENYKPEILQRANRLLEVNLGIARWKTKEEIKNELSGLFNKGKEEERENIDPIELLPRPRKGSVAARILKDWGMRITDVAITDLEELGKIREKLAGLIEVQIKRTEIRTEALGNKEKDELEGTGTMRKLLQTIRSFETDEEKMKLSIDEYIPSGGALAQFQQWFTRETWGKMSDKGSFYILPGMSEDGSTPSDVIGWLKKLAVSSPFAKKILEETLGSEKKEEKEISPEQEEEDDSSS